MPVRSCCPPGTRSLPDRTAEGWWSHPRYLAALALLSAAPLLWPSLPPLTDALGHLARYHIETALDRSSALQAHYGFQWQLIGNLGVDLLIVPLTALFGVEFATKLVVLAIPVLTATGLILVAVQLHGRATPFTAFALPLAYGYPLQFGFLNYCLAVALALLAFAAWLALGRAGRIRLRAALFVVVGLLLWLCHVYGWAVLGLLVVTAEWARLRGAGRSVARTVRDALFAAWPLLPPLLPMLLWRSGEAGGDTGHWLDLSAKLAWLIAMLRDRWEGFDRASAGLLIFIVIAGWRSVGITRTGGAALLVLLAAFVALPHLLLGSAYADMRLAPLVVALGLVALKPPSDRRWAHVVAIGALAFFLVRTVATTASFAWYDRAYREQLAAIPHIPRGARVVAFVGTRCQSDWVSARMEHLAGLATVRRDAFVNDQWALRGAQLLTVRHPAAGAFAGDPSQIVRPAGCRAIGEPAADGLIPRFPARAFDYLWLVNLPGAASLDRPGLVRMWARPDGALYRINPAGPPRPPAHRPGSASR